MQHSQCLWPNVGVILLIMIILFIFSCWWWRRGMITKKRQSETFDIFIFFLVLLWPIVSFGLGYSLK